MIINHNMSAIYANRQIRQVSREMDSTMEKLSSGMKINRAGDNASGLAVSEKLRGYIRGLKQAEVNAQDGISFIQTTEGALGEIHSILHRVRELAIQSSNGLYTERDRKTIQVEVSQLLREVDRIANTTSFNGFKMLTGGFQQGVASAEPMVIHIGADSGLEDNADAGTPDGPGGPGAVPPPAGAAPPPASTQPGKTKENHQQIELYINSSTREGLGLSKEKVKVQTSDDALNSLKRLDTAVERVSGARANLGAYQNRLEYSINYLEVARENLMAAESRIRDADMAAETVKFTRQQILIQSGTAMLVQANIKPQAILQLLG